MEVCGDNRFEIIAKAKEHLLDATNIDTSEDEMKVLDDFLFRCWQMGWLDRYDEPKTEPQTDNLKAVIALQEYLGIKREPTLSEMVEDEPQTDCAWGRGEEK